MRLNENNEQVQEWRGAARASAEADAQNVVECTLSGARGLMCYKQDTDDFARSRQSLQNTRLSSTALHCVNTKFANFLLPI
jgi:hypothetical protein